RHHPAPLERPSMSRRAWFPLFLAGLVGLLPAPAAAAAPLPKTVDFNRDIRPILADNCYACHGPDKAKRKAGLRLDTREGLFSAKGDVTTITPGKADKSELFLRITTADKYVRMPDPKSGKCLSERQIALV